MDYLKERLHKTQTVEIIDNAPFIKDLFKKMHIIDPKSLKFASTRHKSLLQTYVYIYLYSLCTQTQTHAHTHTHTHTHKQY